MFISVLMPAMPTMPAKEMHKATAAHCREKEEYGVDKNAMEYRYSEETCNE